jgi:hypothetical protein
MTGVEATSAFAGDPQPVEVFHRGIWYSGELLGWRHDPDGGCRARVRCVVNGLRQSAWMDLGDLRLPRPVVAEDGPAPAAAGQHSRPPIPPAALGRHDAADDETQPHLLLPNRRTRARPAAVTLPPPRYPRPSEQTGHRLSAV